MKYCKILIPINSNDEFIYSFDKNTNITIGSVVVVNFRNRKVFGLVIEILNNTTIKNVKKIIDLHMEKPINKKYLDFINWMSDYYFTTRGNILRNLLPSLTKNTKHYIYNNGDDEIMMKIKTLSKGKSLSKTTIKNIIKKTYTFDELLNKKFIIEEIDNYYEIRKPNIKLNKEQELAYKNVKESIDKNEHKTFLLFGVPASGKSEVYIKLIDYVINSKKKNILLLLPEIGLAEYVYKIIRQRFGTNATAILHSELSDGERYFHINAINNNKKKIIIGTRSAVFAPIKDLGLVIIDEEQDMSYKQDATPFYNGRDVGIYLAYKNKVPALLCTATPSAESYYNAKIGKYELIHINKSYTNVEKPKIEIHYNNFSNNIPIYILDNISKTLRENKQVIIFINRRGYLNLFKCKECGEYFKCDNCSVSYSFHKKENMFVCHYCGSKKTPESVCNKCGGKLISTGVYGTEKIESILKKLYPDNNIIRMDLDSSSHKGERKKIIEKMIKKQTDILIGTQIISKGYDIPNVNTVIILNADSVINMPDIRSEEHFMQLLIQTAGRAGRRDKRGIILIETSEAIKGLEKYINNLDYKTFIENELKKRENLKFPPYTKMLRIIVKDKKKEQCKRRIYEIYNLFYKEYKKQSKKYFIVYSPTPAIVEKVNKVYRYNIFIVYNNFNKIRNIIGKIKEQRNDFLIDNDTL